MQRHFGESRVEAEPCLPGGGAGRGAGHRVHEKAHIAHPAAPQDMEGLLECALWLLLPPLTTPTVGRATPATYSSGSSGCSSFDRPMPFCFSLKQEVSSAVPRETA